MLTGVFAHSIYADVIQTKPLIEMPEGYTDGAMLDAPRDGVDTTGAEEVESESDGEDHEA
jgi:hypothetical protein